ncbi:MAG: hypothetical protein U9O82_03680, partial [Thermodesulfobacteriota bacterium]|nr:hypothetical protein [Thermodesulfobacteriota bacterium]
RVMRIYEIAWSPSQKGDTDKQVCPCHPSPIASPKSVIIRKIFFLTPNNQKKEEMKTCAIYYREKNPD